MKCSKHPDKDAAAMCEKCNLFYCGSCVLSSNGKCLVCANPLRSPEIVPFGLDPVEIYRKESPPKLSDAMRSIYLEPVRTMRRLKEHASPLVGVANIAFLFLILTMIRIVAVFVVLSFLAPAIPGGMGLKVLSSAIRSFFELESIFAFLINLLFSFGVFVVSWLILSALLYVPAKLLAGKGTFVQQSSLISYVMFAMLPFPVIALILALVPSVGIWLALLTIVLALIYLAFLAVLVIREIHEFNTTTSIISFLISSFILIALATIFIVLLYPPFIIMVFGKLLPLSI